MLSHLLQAKGLPFEQQKQAVQQNLHSQLVNIGRSINTCLVQVRPPSSCPADKTSIYLPCYLELSLIFSLGKLLSGHVCAAVIQFHCVHVSAVAASC